jgi:hypothetical protein
MIVISFVNILEWAKSVPLVKSKHLVINTHINTTKIIMIIRCSLSHNLEEYLAIKPKDAGDKCVLFDLYGK